MRDLSQAHLLKDVAVIRFCSVGSIWAIVTGPSFRRKGIHSVNIYPEFSLTGRTLDTAEGKPGSLKQTADEVNCVF